MKNLLTSATPPLILGATVSHERRIAKVETKAGGFSGPLHQCSTYGSKDAGRKLQAMLAMGASRPWPDALEALTGQRQIDATALLDYFAPLRAWLKQQNRGRRCGW